MTSETQNIRKVAKFRADSALHSMNTCLTLAEYAIGKLNLGHPNNNLIITLNECAKNYVHNRDTAIGYYGNLPGFPRRIRVPSKFRGNIDELNRRGIVSGEVSY